MKLELEGKVAIVGGGSKGIGYAIARGLAREGARVCLYARNQEDLDAAAARLRDETGTDVITVAADAREGADLERIVETTVQELGGVDVLVANQGGPGFGDALDATDDMWTKGWELTHMSVVRLARLVVPEMRKRGGGRIIAITTLGVLEHVPGLAVSSAARLALTGYATHLAKEVGKDGICVNNVLPGWTATEAMNAYLKTKAEETGRTVDEVKAEVARDVPMGRLGEPEEVADLVAFLASARAKYITGGNFRVDGGNSSIMVG